MLPETTVLPPSRSMDEEDDATELLSESLFHSCMSSFDDNQIDDVKEVADADEEKASSPDSQRSITESRQPHEVTATEATTSSDATDSMTQPAAAETFEVSHAETNNSTGGVNSTSSASNSNSSWSLLSESNERPTIHSITFNRDRTCLIVSTSVGVRIRTLESIHLMNNDDDNTDNNHSNNLTYDVPLLPDGATYSQLLHNTSLLVVIKPSTPRCCYLYNAKNAAFPLAALPLSAAVKRVELTRRVLAALTVDGRVHVFHMADGGGDLTQQMNDTEGRKALRPTWIQTLNIMHPSDSCRSLTRGMDIFNVGSYFDLSCEEELPLLVCKSFNGTSGTIRVYDPTVVEEVSMINKNSSSSSNVSVGSGAGSNASSWDYYQSTTPTKKKKRRIKLLSTIDAHEHSVTRMVIGSSGSQSFLATTSSKGTTIRLFGLPRGDFLWEFHRGSRSCQFYSLAWSGSADRLVTYGSSGTVHVFSWPKEKDVNVDETNNTDHVEEGDFQHVTDSSTRSGSSFHTQKKASEKPLLRRIGASIRQPKKATTTKPLKHRSFAKLKYKPPTASPTDSKKRNPQSQSIIVSLLDRRNDGGTIDKNDLAQNEGTLVMCSIDGELRQYSVTNEGHIQLAQLEDVLS
ncbi:WD40 repeat-containing protein [Skeletonema marinoi]|uniref:WD40 repeat-containing protein n=1 Tax=Skeletonema marinoi TaxID=267567 RepID=A0AAD8XXZ8_9STRA|nr:WD40 repeat-containing protein [Skeletonema marinoi]